MHVLKSHAHPCSQYCVDVMQYLLLSHVCHLNWRECWEIGIWKTAVFSDVIWCCLVEKHQCFGGKNASYNRKEIQDNTRLTKFQNYAIFRRLEKLNSVIFQHRTKISLWYWKRYETKMAENYYWTITQAEGLSFWCRSCSSVLQFGFQLDHRVHTTVFDQMYNQFQLAQN